MPDPTLLAAMEEIKAILKKHDIAGNVVLASRTHMEFLRRLEASWNGIRVEEHGENLGIRVRCMRADYPSVEAWQEAMRLTVGTIMGFHHALELDATAMKQLAMMLATKMEIQHVDVDEGPRRRF